MDAAHFLTKQSADQARTIKILFTPDEEIGRVSTRLTWKSSAPICLHNRRETAGNIEDETSRRCAIITIEGVSTHPALPKAKMEHAIKIAAAIVERLPNKLVHRKPPRAKSFLHRSASKDAEESHAEFHRARFHRCGLEEKEALLKSIVRTDEDFRDQLPPGDQAAVPQHERGDRSPS